MPSLCAWVHQKDSSDNRNVRVHNHAQKPTNHFDSLLKKYSTTMQRIISLPFREINQRLKVDRENMIERFVSKKAMPNKHKKCTRRTSFFCVFDGHINNFSRNSIFAFFSFPSLPHSLNSWLRSISFIPWLITTAYTHTYIELQLHHHCMKSFYCRRGKIILKLISSL